MSTTSGRTAVIRRAFVTASAAWAASIPAAAMGAAQPHATAATSAFALAVYAAGAVVCHQLPSRSFHVLGRQLPVCARCTGIYVGAALAAVLAATISRPTAATRLSPRILALLACVPTAATLVVEWTTGVTLPNWVRAAAGAALGAPIAWLVASEPAAP